jgi:hypothetical protein
MLADKLNQFFIEEDVNVENIAKARVKIANQDEAIIVAQSKHKEMLQIVDNNERKCKQIAQDIVKNEMDVHRAFRKFEEAAASTHRSDLEELCRMVNPDLTVRLAVLIFGAFLS